MQFGTNNLCRMRSLKTNQEPDRSIARLYLGEISFVFRCSRHKGTDAVLDLTTLKRQWGDLTAYERFEQIVSRFVMLLISAVIVYSLIIVSINLFNQFTLELTFADVTALKDVFGSILTILILIEFNHSIALAVSKRSGVLQARYIVLIAILVIARKVILLDFNTASFESLIGISGVALAFGLLYWLISVRSGDGAVETGSQRGSNANERMVPP
jgi:uncharacterized membrane protein (DUF373 family)